MLLDQCWNNSDGLFLGTAHGSPLQCSPIKCVRNFCMVRIVWGWTKPLGKTGSEPLWTRALVCCWFVIAQMWETLTSSHGSPWSQMEGAKMKQARPMGRKADTPSVMSSCKGQTECPAEPRFTSGSPSITKLITNRLEGVLRLKPDTCLPVTDLSPQAILWAEHSWIQNKHVSQRACVSLNRVQIECPETLMLISLMSSAAGVGIPHSPSRPHLRTS